MARGLRVEAFGQMYELKPDEVTAEDAKAFRRFVGVPLMSVMGGSQDMDLDVVAGIIWLARVKNGEPGVTYQSVASRLTYGSEIDFPDVREAQEGAPAPEDEKPTEADLPEG